VKLACEALEQSQCLELQFASEALLIEVHAVGFDEDDRPVVLGYENSVPEAIGGGWRYLHLDETKRIAITSLRSHAPRPDVRRNDPRFRHIICQI
jgi:hypothetical protein